MALAFTTDLRQRIRAYLGAHDVRVLEAPPGLRHAGVGVVLLPDDQARACFILTRRVETLRRHGGQWALPGGRLELNETPLDAALREIHEEVGLRLEPASVLGRLDDFVSRSGHLISTIVVWAECDGPLVISPDEVEAAYRVPLEDLDRPDALQHTPLLHFLLPSLGSSVHAPTAAILYQFREVGLHGRSVRVADVEQPYFAWR